MAEISRTDALALINQQNSQEIWDTAAKTSVALATFRTVPMSSKQRRMPVIDVLPGAGFVGEVSGSRQKLTTRVAWVNKILEAEEIATIVPIHENVFDDTEFNVWETVRPKIAEAIGLVLDQAVFFGVGKPVSWPDDIWTGADAAGNVFERGTGVDLAEDLNQLMALVEEDGFDPDTFWSHVPEKKNLRGLRDADDRPLFVENIRDKGITDAVWGLPIAWVANDSWVPGAAGGADEGADFIVGDADAAILGLRQDMTFKILDQATLTDGAGAVEISLAEEDMIALRVKMRVGFQVADPTTRLGGSGAYPFAILKNET